MKRVFCMLLAVVMLLAIAGCSSKETGSDNSDATTTDSAVENDALSGNDELSSTESKTESKNPSKGTQLADDDRGLDEVGLPHLDIKSSKVRILNWADPSELKDPESTMYQFNTLMKKYYKCQVTYITTTYEELPVRAAQLVMSGQSPDLIFYKEADYPNFINKNIAQPVDQYIDFSNKYFAAYKPGFDQMKINGKYYLMVTSVENDGYVFYWKNKFKDIGEKTPLELYKNGQWTWDKFRQVSKALTVDSNSDGVPEQYGSFIQPMYYYTAFGEDMVKFNADGSVSNNIESKAVAKAMDLLYNTGAKGDNSRLQTYKSKDFENGKVVMMLNQKYLIYNYAEQFRAGTIEFAPFPKDSTSSAYTAPGRVGAFWMAKNAPNPGGAVAYIAISSMLKNDAAYKAKQNKFNQEKYGINASMAALVEEMNNQSKFKLTNQLMMGVGNWYSNGMWNCVDDVAVKGTPWSTVMAKYKPVLEAECATANKKK